MILTNQLSYHDQTLIRENIKLTTNLLLRVIILYNTYGSSRSIFFENY
jgi:hypothetical protein